MKIEKITLKNFAAIYNAMKCKEFSIDFSKSLNKVCLIIGPNGAGKTTILSLLHPFAGIGNLDIRDSLNLILDGENGYKEISISNGNDIYVIKHFYTSHKDKNHSVKSYISKNGNELNENGNVTSFKEYVRMELGIEPDHLKLIRIGTNVTSLIDLTETERKTYMSKLLDEIGVFLMYYKKVSNDLNLLKGMIALDVDKINRLGITDKNETIKKIVLMKINIEEAQNNYAEISGMISIYQHEIDSIDNVVTLYDRLSISNKKLDKMNKILEKINELESTDVSYYVEKISELEKDLIRNQTQIDSTEILIQNYLSTLNQLQEQLRSLKIQLAKEESADKEVRSLREEHRKISKNIASSEILLGDYNPNFTKEEFDNFYVFIKNIQQKLDKTYEFGKEVNSKIIALLMDNKNVMNYINSHILDIDGDEDSNMLFLKTIARRFNFNNKKIDNCNDISCDARQLWIQVGNLLQNNEVEKKKKKDISFYKDMEYAYQNIREILLSFVEYKGIIERLPDIIKNDFKIENIYASIAACEKIYKESEMNDVLSVITEYNNLINMKKNADELEKEISKYEQISNYAYITDQIEIVTNQIEDYSDLISKSKRLISDLKEKIKEISNNIETYTDLKETFEKHDELETEVNKLTDEYNRYVENKRLIQECEDDKNRIKYVIDSLTDEVQKLTSGIEQYETIKKELDIFNRKYDEITLTREALSSKKGMSLYYIKNYLGNTAEITNELLDIAYDGQIYIDDFKITPTEFTIPFYNRGTLIKDVKYASQGELSFLSIALSFGLASQTLQKYNIMLLDEIDGPLDTRNREKFIRILENQIDRIKSEQNFLITHNDMFSSYPVDIIDLGFNADNKKYELANYIDIIRK